MEVVLFWLFNRPTSYGRNEDNSNESSRDRCISRSSIFGLFYNFGENNEGLKELTSKRAGR